MDRRHVGHGGVRAALDMRRTGAKGGHSRVATSILLLREVADEFHRGAAYSSSRVPYCVALCGRFFFEMRLSLELRRAYRLNGREVHGLGGMPRNSRANGRNRYSESATMCGTLRAVFSREAGFS